MDDFSELLKEYYKAKREQYAAKHRLAELLDEREYERGLLEHECKIIEGMFEESKKFYENETNNAIVKIFEMIKNGYLDT